MMIDEPGIYFDLKGEFPELKAAILETISKYMKGTQGMPCCPKIVDIPKSLARTNILTVLIEDYLALDAATEKSRKLDSLERSNKNLKEIWKE